MSEDIIKTYTKKKIEYIELVQKDLEEFKNRELFLKEPLNSLTKTKETMLLSAAINLLQELISVYGSVLQEHEGRTMTKEQIEHLKKVYTAYYSQIDFTKDFCEQNIKHIVNIQKQPTYCSTPLFKFDGETTALVYTFVFLLHFHIQNHHKGNNIA